MRADYLCTLGACCFHSLRVGLLGADGVGLGDDGVAAFPEQQYLL